MAKIYTNVDVVLQSLNTFVWVATISFIIAVTLVHQGAQANPLVAVTMGNAVPKMTITAKTTDGEHEIVATAQVTVKAAFTDKLPDETESRSSSFHFTTAKSENVKSTWIPRLLHKLKMVSTSSPEVSSIAIYSSIQTDSPSTDDGNAATHTDKSASISNTGITGQSTDYSSVDNTTYISRLKPVKPTPKDKVKKDKEPVWSAAELAIGALIGILMVSMTIAMFISVLWRKRNYYYNTSNILHLHDFKKFYR